MPISIEHVERVRREVSPQIALNRKAEFGQFMTPSSVAQFMASLFTPNQLSQCNVLDAGAGIGSLSCAFLNRCVSKDLPIPVENIELFAYELDEMLRTHLSQHLSHYTKIKSHVIGGDFIDLATLDCLLHRRRFTHAILNPPYKKMNSNSKHRLSLREAGIETVNLYSAFIALALELMVSGGQLVAIIPRSFCNGTYYRPFREFILQRASIRQMHLFDSRNKAFRDDAVLQENMILVLDRDAIQGNVIITTSTDDTFSDLKTFVHPFDQIVLDSDSEKFIHIPTSHDKNIIDLSSKIRYSLTDIGIKASTGPVVDFRMKDFLLAMPEHDSVPLLYPNHFKDNEISWPKPDFKKPNAIRRVPEVESSLYANGYYCVVRRFSPKEEKRRIMPSLVIPTAFGEAKMLGFENHFNVFHVNKQGLTEMLARGLVAYLSSTAVDQYFRRFNGHTQVNVSDLKLIQYPSRQALIELGEWAKQQTEMTQEIIDKKLGKMFL